MINDLISILVPVYNVEKHLKDCLMSIIKQTYDNIEVILVNDGSTDSSLEICKQFTNDSRIVIIDKQNEGLSIARQTAIDNSRGKYICIIDSDDYISNNFVEKLYANIVKYNSDIVLCASQFFSETFSKIHGLSSLTVPYREITTQDIENDYAQLLVQYCMSDSWAKMYRKSFLQRSNVTFTLGKEYNGTDLLFNHSLMLHKPVLSLEYDVLYNHRIHADSRVNRKDKKMLLGFQIITTALFDESIKLNYSGAIDKQIAVFYANHVYMAAQDTVNSDTILSKARFKLEQFIDLNNTYLAQQRRLIFNYGLYKTIFSRIFYILLKYKLLYLVCLLFRIRQFKTNTAMYKQ